MEVKNVQSHRSRISQCKGDPCRRQKTASRANDLHGAKRDFPCCLRLHWQKCVLTRLRIYFYIVSHDVESVTWDSSKTSLLLPYTVLLSHMWLTVEAAPVFDFPFFSTPARSFLGANLDYDAGGTLCSLSDLLRRSRT